MKSKLWGVLSLLVMVRGSEAGIAAFDDYADDALREVEVSEDLVLKACLGNSDSANKMKAAYTKCFGANYDLEDFAQDSSADSDSDGLSDNFEKKEMCFYKEAGWSDGSKLLVDNAKAVINGMDSAIKADFDKKVDECNTMTLDSLNRKKRDVEGSGSVSLIRKTRYADAAKKKGKAKGKGKKKARKGKKKGRKGKKKARRGKKKGRKGKKKARKGKKKGRKGKKKARKGKKKGRKGKKKGRSGKKGGKGKKKGGKGRKKNRKGKKGKGGKGKGKGKGGKRSGGNKSGKGKGKGSGKGKGKGVSKGTRNAVDETLYMKLWCVDLSLEQSLQTCLENKIKN